MRAHGGAGLGLSIVSAIADAHGGRVSVAETPGGGATFAVDLPAEPDADGSKQWGLEGFPMIEPPAGNGTDAAPAPTRHGRPDARGPSVRTADRRRPGG